jgi:hypothetical protein
MAMEIEEGSWLYFRNQKILQDGRHELIESLDIKHTPLHDLEPLVWMVVLTLDSRYLNPRHLYPWQTRHFWKVFASPAYKKIFLQNPDIRGWLNVNTMKPKLAHLAELVIPIFDLVARTSDAHEKYQQDLPFDSSVYADHRAPRETLACLAVLAKTLTKPVTLYPTPSARASPSNTSAEPQSQAVNHKQDRDDIGAKPRVQDQPQRQALDPLTPQPHDG